MEKKTNVCGILSLILGIAGILTSCFNLGLVLSIPGILLGIIGCCLPNHKKGLAIAGLVTSTSAFMLIIGLNLFVQGLTDALS